MAFMQIETECGLWLKVSVRGETHYIPPGLVGRPVGIGETVKPSDYAYTVWNGASKSEEGNALVATVAQDAWDTDARRVLADWMEEHGWSEESVKNARYTADLIDAIAEIQEYIEGQIVNPLEDVDSIECWQGWGARYSAPGYMDCTGWSLGNSEQEAIDECQEMYGEDEEEVHYCTEMDCDNEVDEAGGTCEECCEHLQDQEDMQDAK